MPKMNTYPASASIDDTDVFVKEEADGTRTEKVTALQLANYAKSKGANVDATLTKTGVPADAKAAGDAVADLKSAIGYVETTVILPSSAFEQGTLDANTGANSSANNRIRTVNSIDLSASSVSVASGYDYLLYAYRGSYYIGVWSGSEFARGAGAWQSDTFAMANIDGLNVTKLALVLRHHNNSTIAPADGKDIVSVTYTSNNVDEALAKATKNEGMIDALLQPVTNIANPENQISGGVWSSVNTVYNASGYSRLEIDVTPETTYSVDKFSSSFCWFTDDTYQNLGHITTNVFETPEGCTKIRLGKNDTNPFVVIQADMGWTGNASLYEDYPYSTPSSVKINELQNEINAQDNRISAIENIVVPLTTVSMFETIGAIGDSYTSGGIYGVTGVTAGNHYNVSWPQIMARHCGLTATNYSKGGYDVSKWLNDADIGLAKLEADTAKDLYVIVLGINDEKSLSDATADVPVGTTADIDVSDPSQNADTFCGHYGRMLSAILAHAPKAKIILVRPLLTTTAKQTAIINIAALYGLPSFAMGADDYYSSDFYRNNRYTGHPIAATYAGMAMAFERQINQCIVDNISYFTNYAGD